MSKHPTALASIHGVTADDVDVAIYGDDGRVVVDLGPAARLFPRRTYDPDSTVVDDLEAVAAFGEAITRQAERKLRALRTPADPCGGGDMPSAADDGPEAA